MIASEALATTRDTILGTLQESRDYVLSEARANIEFVKANPTKVEQAHQINAALANIVAMERNIVMDKAVERALKKDEAINLPHVPQPESGA
jgi:hypothetical protein